MGYLLLNNSDTSKREIERNKYRKRQRDRKIERVLEKKERAEDIFFALTSNNNLQYDREQERPHVCL
jgi:hypothetical protein